MKSRQDQTSAFPWGYYIVTMYVGVVKLFKITFDNEIVFIR